MDESSGRNQKISQEYDPAFQYSAVLAKLLSVFLKLFKHCETCQGDFFFQFGLVIQHNVQLLADERISSLGNYRFGGWKSCQETRAAYCTPYVDRTWNTSQSLRNPR